MKIPHIFDSEHEWLQSRIGKIGGTRISALISDAKREMTDQEKIEHKKNNPKSTAKLIVDDNILSSAACNMLDEVIAEILTGQSKYVFPNNAMDRGKELEPFAFSEFCRVIGFDTNDPEILHFGVRTHGIYLENQYVASSPDFAVIFQKAIGEIKCEGSDKHLKYLRINTGLELKKLEPDHYEQLQYNMLLGDAEMGYFVSFDDRYKKEALRVKIIPVELDTHLHSKMIKKLTAGVEYISKELELIANIV